MLGWPSPVYPKLLKEDTPIPITLDLTAMIAGFLMLGNIVSAPFSTWSYTGSKYGVIIGLMLMISGWLVMWQAKNFYWLLISRFIIGLGSGFGLGQLKIYIKEMCQSNVAQVFLKLINSFIFLGIITVYSFGPYVDFRTLSAIAAIFCVIISGLCLLLPHTPVEYLKMDKEEKCKKLLRYLQPENAEIVLYDLKECLDKNEINLTLTQILRNRNLRCNAMIFTLLVYFQQFTGPPSTLVYSQIIFKNLHTNRPDLCAIVYVTVWLCSNFYSTFCQNFNKKYLLFSCASVSVILAINIYVIYGNYNETHWNYISFVLMLFYIFFHTIGLGNASSVFLEEKFTKESKDVMSKGFWMLFSAFALIITKIFQVFYERCHLYFAFCLFLCHSLVAFVFVAIFYSDDKKK